MESVAASGRAQGFTQLAKHLDIQLASALKKGRTIRLTVVFLGTPTKGLRFSVSQAFTVYNTSHWMVVNHVLDDLATFQLRLRTAKEVVVIGNGKNLTSRRRGAEFISDWLEKRAIPDFVMGFAVGPFTVATEKAGETELRYASENYSEADLRHMLHSTPQALKFFADKAGVAYPSRTYSQVLVAGDPEQELGDFTLLPDSYGRD